MRKLSVTLLSSIACGSILLGGLFYRYVCTAPGATKLLPEADALLYLDIAPLRRATHFDRAPIARSPEFQQFIDATGIVPERDLDAVSFALHSMADPHGPNGPVAYSEIFVGRFDNLRLARYLATIANAQETYSGHIIYAIPSDGRTLRVAQLDAHTVAASNCPTPEQIHAILEHHSRGTWFSSGPSLLASHFGDVPILSSAWAIGQIGLPFAENGRITVMGLGLPLASDTRFIASLRYTRSLHLRVEEISPDALEARQTAEQLTSLLSLVRGLEPVPSRTPGDRAMRELTSAITIEQEKDRAVLKADLPDSLLRELAGLR
jgi:hypothetical protein